MAYSNHDHDYRSDSPDRSKYYRSKNQPSTDFSDPMSLLQALQNNTNLQDPQCLNKIIIPMLLVQLLQNQQCQHCPDGNRQASYPEQHRPRRQRSFHDGLDAPVQEVYSVPPGRYRSNEYILDQSPPSIQCSDEEIKHACCDSSPDLYSPLRRRNLIPSHSHHNSQRQIARTRSPSPEPRIVERCYWCRQQLYKYYDPDLCKRVFTHFPCHRGALLAAAGKSSYGSIRQVSLVDTSPFNPECDVMLPCPYLCAKTETTYNSSFRHPEVVARESACRLVSKKSQPWEQSSNAPLRQGSVESLGHLDKPGLPNRRREERVMFVKPNCCPNERQMSQMTNSSRDNARYDRRYQKPRRYVTLANTSLDAGYNSRTSRPEPCVSFSPSTDAYQRRRAIDRDMEKENVMYYNCHPSHNDTDTDGGYGPHHEPDRQSLQRRSRSSVGRGKVMFYNCHPPQKSKHGGYDLYCKPDRRHHRRRSSGRVSRSSSMSIPSRSRRSRRSRGNLSSPSRHSRRSRGNASSPSRHSRRSQGDESGRSRRRHSAPQKSRSQGSRVRRQRAKSDIAIGVDVKRGPRHHSRSSRGRRRSRSSRRRRRHSRPRYSMSDPATATQQYCQEFMVCCPSFPMSVYNASYGNPAEHPYYEGPSDHNFRRHRFETN